MIAEPAVKERGVNQRTFEIAAIGVPQVVDFRGDLERHLVDRKEVLVYRSVEEMRALVRPRCRTPRPPSRWPQRGDSGCSRSTPTCTGSVGCSTSCARPVEAPEPVEFAPLPGQLSAFPQPPRVCAMVKVSGFTIIKNAISHDFPVEASIRSLLPVCDEVVVNVGPSTDGTMDLIKSIKDPKIRIIEGVCGCLNCT